MNAEELGKLSIKCRNIAIGLHQSDSRRVTLSPRTFDYISIEEDGTIYASFSEYLCGENNQCSIDISDEELAMDTTEMDKTIKEKEKAEAIKRAEAKKQAEEASERKKLYEAKMAEEKEYELFLELQKKYSKD